LKELNGIKKFLLAIDIFTFLDEKKVGVVVDDNDDDDDDDDEEDDDDDEEDVVVVIRILDKSFNVRIDRLCNIFNSL
jgi:hypothetical protein